MTDARGTEEELLHPTPKWYYKLLNGEVTQDPGPDRMGPYPSQEAAQHAMETAKERNEEWKQQDAEWNDK